METPLLKQYNEMKKKHPDTILLFRIGDFYEAFKCDAVDISQILGITLTRRANGKADMVELAGFPHHALDTYLPRLVRAGKRVAICEQLEQPQKKAIIKKSDASRTIETSKQQTFNIMPFLSAFKQLTSVIGQVVQMIEIREKTKEIMELAYNLKQHPKTLFNCCFEDLNKIPQPSLFE